MYNNYEEEMGRLLACFVCEHPKRREVLRMVSRNKPWLRGYLSRTDSEVESMLRQKNIKVKASAIVADSMVGGEYFLEDKAVWNNFGRLQDLLKESGSKLTAGDLQRRPNRWTGYGGQQAETKSYIEMAGEYKALGKIFNADFWEGRYDEMMGLYMDLPEKYRGQVKIMSLRRDLARLEGKPLREDVLDNAGITIKSLQQALRSGKLDKVDTKLRQAGSKLTKEDVLLMGEKGELFFDDARVWQQFDAIQAKLEKNSEAFTVDDLTTSRHGRASLVTRAGKLGVLAYVFHPEIWKGDVESLDKLYQKVPNAALGTMDFDLIRSEVKAEGYKVQFALGRSLKKSDLLKKRVGKNMAPLAKFGTWQKMEQIQSFLAAKNEALTLDDLRKKSAPDGASFLEIGLRHGFIGKVLEIAKLNNDNLTFDDLSKTGSNNRTALEEIMHKGQLEELFDGSNWVGRVGEMQNLWRQVPIAARSQVKDYGHELRLANRLSLKEITSKKVAAPAPKNTPKNPTP